ncbi:MAG: beta-ketoacyl reductase, partial [Candidatus Tectomicrobia bacterium]|nr:beta-ketoacyl reductase [Candidatus Tectomicrobia bacterium]
HPLRGVVHAAGGLDDGVLQQQTWERFARVLAPKVWGAWHLHTLTRDMPLDFFVLFSSAASLLGAPGQGNYAAANAFLDALAHYRRAHGLLGVALNWGAWAEVGMAAKRIAHLELHGMGAIAPEQGLCVLEQVCTSPWAQVGVVPIDWTRFTQRAPFLADIVPGAPAAGVAPLRQQLEATPITKRRALLQEHVGSIVGNILGWESSRSVDFQQGFFDLGMDSLTSLELRNRLQISLECGLPATLTFTYASVDTLVDYVVQEVLSPTLAFDEKNVTGNGAPASEADTSSSLEAALEALSQDELANLLAQKLASMSREGPR